MAASGPTPGGRGRFDGYDVVDQVDTWDDETRAVVSARLTPARRVSFFGVDEAACARALLDLLLAQHEEPRVPVLELVDERLARHQGDGWRYDDLPEDGRAWKISLAALDREADRRHGRRFCDLDAQAQKDILDDVHDRDGEWQGLPAAHVFDLWMRYACAAFYSHPWAWNEIGFGGPAYPRGYENLGIDKRERWERRERDAADPIPWVNRAEAARRAHEGLPPERDEVNDDDDRREPTGTRDRSRR